MRTTASRLLGALTLHVRGVATGRVVVELHHFVSQDGSSSALHDGWRDVFPGRFTVVKPAAGARLTTLDRLGDAPPTVVLPPDTTHAPAFVPAPAALEEAVTSLACHAQRTHPVRDRQTGRLQ